VEVNADHVSGSVEIAAKDFRQHTSENGLFTGDLRLEGSHIGVESLGRQGAFDYQPTARDTTLKAEAALRRD